MDRVSLRELVFTGVAGMHIASAADSDSRPEVRYKPVGHIMLGSGAIIIPVNHYNTPLVSNGGVALTGKVIAYDKVTGAFETKRTRYVLDTSYAH